MRCSKCDTEMFNAKLTANNLYPVILTVSDFMSCRWSDFITGQQVASFFVIDSFR